MNIRHHVLRVADRRFETPGIFHGRSQGYRRCAAVGDASGSVHMGFGVVELDSGGHVDWHVRSYEESIYVLSGEVICDTEDDAFLLREGDYGIIAVGAPHAWRNAGSGRATWTDMLAPQPRGDASTDTFFVQPPRDERDPIEVDPRDPRTRSFGHIEPENMDPDKQTQDVLALSASMRTALLVYSGITVKMMVDTDLGADLMTMFMVQYDPEGAAGAHDHPLEEAYMILEGEVDAMFDGQPYRLAPGDIAWAGVGCPHQFSNPGEGIVRWLETQAPQPPRRHSYRFARDWDYLRDALASGG